MPKKYQRGEWVRWNWGGGHGTAKVVDSHTDRVTRTIKGQRISRNGTQDNPAYVLETENGTTVLKLHSELAHDD